MQYATPLFMLLALAATGCTARSATITEPLDSGSPESDAATLDAGAEPDAGRGALCGCRPGPHDAAIFLLGADASLWSFDPLSLRATFVVGPVCAGVARPFSMAVDPFGRAWILDSETRRLSLFDLVTPGACVDSGYLPTVRELPYFGMAFVHTDPARQCASLFAHSYSGASSFRVGPGLGTLAVIDGDPPRARPIASIDYDGGELTGTGDGRLFAFAGARPAEIIEYHRDTGALIDRVVLDGFATTNAHAFAFFGGDLYLFTEAQPPECGACLETECPTAWAACEADAECAETVACAIERAMITDECGGTAGAEMHECLSRCSMQCLTRPAVRTSAVTLLDWDESEGPGRARREIVQSLPLRVVGAGTSPCVPTLPI